jgi:uncharacterized protein YydD (DUF2326 family)
MEASSEINFEIQTGNSLMTRSISFTISDETEKLLLALSSSWKKDPIELAKALFVEELTANMAGSHGIPHLRRYIYRDANVYFTKEELAVREREMEAYWQSPESQAVRKEQQENLEIFKSSTNKMSKDQIGSS